MHALCFLDPVNDRRRPYCEAEGQDSGLLTRPNQTKQKPNPTNHPPNLFLKQVSISQYICRADNSLKKKTEKTFLSKQTKKHRKNVSMSENSV